METEKTVIKKRLEQIYPKGSTVVLERMDDIHAPPVGTKGTVRYIDNMCTIHVS